MMAAFEVLIESLSIWHLTIARRNSYRSVLSVSTVTVPLWWRGFLSWHVQYVSLEHYCQAEVFRSWYMQIVEPLQSLQAWPTWLLWSSLMNTPLPSPLRWRRLSLITTPTSILNDMILSWKQKEAPKLAVKGNRFWSRSIITTLASFLEMAIKKPNNCTPGLSWPTITRQIKDPISCIQTSTTSVQQGVSLKTRSISVTSGWLRISCTLKSSRTKSKKKKILWKTRRIWGWPVILHPTKKWRNKGKWHYPASVPSHP